MKLYFEEKGILNIVDIWTKVSCLPSAELCST